MAVVDSQNQVRRSPAAMVSYIGPVDLFGVADLAFAPARNVGEKNVEEAAMVGLGFDSWAAIQVDFQPGLIEVVESGQKPHQSSSRLARRRDPGSGR